MKRFKSIVLTMQGKNKSNLIWLYNTKFNPSLDVEEKEKIFTYSNLKFWFGGVDRRNNEKLMMFISIPINLVGIDFDNSIPIENYLLGYLSPIINELSLEYLNINKNIREKAQFSAQVVNENMMRRNGMLYDKDNQCFIMKLNFNVPLFNALSVNAKSTVRAVRDILDNVEYAIKTINKIECQKYIKTYAKQQEIRSYLHENYIYAFIADGSVLPRENGTIQPKLNAVPFKSPDNLRITIPFSDGTNISGMAIDQGVTVITGGGYSGKSTLLNAIEMGIYNHIPGDGREFVITDETAIKIYAEDGRPVHNIDMSPFFKYLPSNDIKTFSTTHASGSISQAANIIEAVCGRSNLLLIDEDRSATNFMIRDNNMRRVVKNEPIIPFTDRVRELYSVKGVSTILVIGGSSEYLRYADTVILMNDYLAKDITNEIKKEFYSIECEAENSTAGWIKDRYLIPMDTNQPFLYIKSVTSENQKKIVLDEYTADITFLTALVSEYQLSSLAKIMEQILTDKEIDRSDLFGVVNDMTSNLYTNEIIDKMLSWNWWYEAIRPIDVFCCANRMRGLNFKNTIY